MMREEGSEETELGRGDVVEEGRPCGGEDGTETWNSEVMGDMHKRPNAKKLYKTSARYEYKPHLPPFCAPSPVLPLTYLPQVADHHS
jgi:hypothetical protein